MVAAALVAKKAVEKGLTRKPWVKTIARPGLEGRHRLLRPRRPDARTSTSSASTSSATAAPPASATPARCRRRSRKAVNEHDLAVTSVLSGNRNFEGRINPDVKMNYLASPPLVVAYALAGSMNVDITTEPLGHRHRRQAGLPRGHLALAEAEERSSLGHRPRACSPSPTRTSSPATPSGRRCRPRRQHLRVGRRVHLRAQAPVLRGHDDGDHAGHRHRRRPRAGQAGRLGHHRPHLPGRRDQGRHPGRQVPHRARRRAQRLQLLRLAPRQPRGHDPRHVRQHPPAQPARATGTEGGFTRDFTRRRRADVDLRRLAELRRPRAPRWSSWRARSTAPARRATGRPRAPRCSASGPSSPSPTSASTARTSIGMGVLPLQFPEGETAESLGLTGEETFAISGVTALNDGATPRTVKVTATEAAARRRVRRGRAHRHPRRGGLLPQRRHHAVRAAQDAGLTAPAVPSEGPLRSIRSTEGALRSSPASLNRRPARPCCPTRARTSCSSVRPPP